MDEKILKEIDYTCPICNQEFSSLRIRDGAGTFIDTDSDLRPYFKEVDPVKYEVVTCKYCGYSSISKTFDKVRPDRVDIIESKLDEIFDNNRIFDGDYDYETAIYRFKLAIKISEERLLQKGEMFYLYLKLAWLFRAIGGTNNLKYEFVSLKRALEYGEEALINESMPIIDIDSQVFVYLLGEISRRLGYFDKALKYITQIVTDQSATPRLKERAQHAKELIKIDKLFKEENQKTS